MPKEWVFEKVDVDCYAGYKGEEAPRAFSHSGKRYEIREILDRWYEEGPAAPSTRYEYFKVKSREGEIFLLRYVPSEMSWWLCRKVPSPPFSNN
jgi:hypothetical protein